MYRVKLKENHRISKIQQIVDAVVKDIEVGVFPKEKQLPSINQFSDENHVARETVEKAYRQLKKRGFIASIPGRGYYVLGKNRKRLKVLLIFNKLSSFKKIIYESLIEELGAKAKVDLQIHHYDPKKLKEILEEHLGKYDYFVIMPHFFSNAKEKEYIDIIKMVPAHELILLDKNLPQLHFPYRAVYQDFKKDIYEALSSSASHIIKYKSIILILPEEIHHPKEIAESIEQFSNEKHLKFSIIDSVGSGPLIKDSIYIVTDEDNLATLLKKIRELKLELRKDLGIISFNETVFKELLDITVISTDFAQMGRTAAKLILGKECEQYNNPFYLIQRGSL